MSFVNLQVIEKNKQKRVYKKQWVLFLCLTSAIMGHVHAPGKRLSHLALPYNCTVTSWLKLTSDDMKEQSYKMAKKFLISWKISKILRETHMVLHKYVLWHAIKNWILKSKNLLLIFLRVSIFYRSCCSFKASQVE